MSDTSLNLGRREFVDDDGDRVVIERSLDHNDPDYIAALTEDHLGHIGFWRWIGARCSEAMMTIPLVVMLVHAPAMILGGLLISLGLLLHLLPQDYMSRHNGNDITYIKPLVIGSLTIMVLFFGTLIWLFGWLGALALPALAVIAWFIGLKVAIT